MAALAANPGEYKVPSSIIWPSSSEIIKAKHEGTGSISNWKGNKPSSFLHTSINYNSFFNSIDDYKRLKTDKEFINLENVFKSQFAELKDYFDNIDFNEAKLSFAKSASALLDVFPDVISMDLTSDQSIFYTLNKNSYTFFIQHYLQLEDKDDDEMILSVFRNSIKLPSYAGSMSDTIVQINNFISYGEMRNFELPLHEFSN